MNGEGEQGGRLFSPLSTYLPAASSDRGGGILHHSAVDVNVESVEVSSIAGASLQRLEADCFWCFSRLLDGIQDNYTFAQPGIQTRINSLKELVSRIDS